MSRGKVSFVNSLGGRMLLLGILPLGLLLTAVIFMAAMRMSTHLRHEKEVELKLLAERVAAEVERGNTRAVMASHLMAEAQVRGLFGDRKASSEFIRRVLAHYPEFTGASIGYEPNADGKDAAYSGTPEAASIGPAFDEQGRFIAYWFREKTDPNRLSLEQLVDMETSMYYQGCKELFEREGRPASLVTEPYIYEGKMLVEHPYPIIIDGEFKGVACTDRALSDMVSFLDRIKRNNKIDIFLISRTGKFVATTVGKIALASGGIEKLQTHRIADTPYSELFKNMHSQRQAPQLERAEDPVLDERCYFASAHVPTGDWLVIARNTEAALLAPIRAQTMRVLGGVLVALIITALLSWWITHKATTRIQGAVAAADQLATGNLSGETRLEGGSRDEVGMLGDSFNQLFSTYRKITDVCQTLARGDFSQRIKRRSGNDELADAINHMADARQKAEAELSKAERRSRLILKSVGDGIFGVDDKGEVDFINPAAARMLGYEHDELLGTNVHAAIHHTRADGSVYDVTECPMRIAFAKGKASRIDDEVLWRKDGSSFPVAYSATPVRDENNQLVGAVVVFTDITQRRQAEAEIKRTNFLSDIALELTDCGYWHIDYSDPDYYFQSDRAAKILGEPLKPDGRYLLQDEWFARLLEANPETAKATEERYLGAIEGRYPHYESTYAYKRPVDGVIVWVHAMGKVVRDDDDSVQYMYGVYQNVTDRKQAELALAAAEQRSRSLLESAPDGMMIADEQGRIVQVNAQFEVLFGYSKDEIIGQPIEVLLPERYRGKHVGQRTSFFQCPSVRSMGSGMELFAQRKDGSEFPVEISLSPLQTDEGMLVSSAIRDISERKQAEAELIKARTAADAANQAKSDFLANMSHEIRTPMNGIMGMTELALDTELNGEQREFLTTIESSADSLLSLINDILDFSKIEAKKLELDPTDFALRERIGETLSTLAVRAHEKGLELAFDVDPAVPERLVGDVHRIRQVLMNLLGNAIKFTERGEILLRIDMLSQETHKVTLRFAVKDTGIGLPAEKLAAIFRPFEQADASTTRKYGGTGLGLAISVRLVELMGGEMKVESQLGSGTTFSFAADLEIGSQSTGSRAATTPPELSGMRVLVVDDNETNRRILAKMLENWGMVPVVVDSAANGLQALQSSLGGQPIGLVLSDVNMPEMDGFMFAQQLKDSTEWKNTPIILLTSANRTGDGARGRDLGIAAHLIKPVRQSLLFDAIATSVGARVAKKPTDNGEAEIERDRCHAMRVLLAEDNEVNQKFAIRALTKAGHSVEVASNGKEAVDTWAGDSFDVVLMDIQMPVMDGYGATAEIRQREATSARHTPIIAMTAHAMKGDKEKCLEAGMDGYVTKPVKSKLLLQEIARVLGTFQSKPGLGPQEEADG